MLYSLFKAKCFLIIMYKNIIGAHQKLSLTLFRFPLVTSYTCITKQFNYIVHV